MSMNEFERQENNIDHELASLSSQGCQCPYDFSADDLAFAEELNALFSPEREELPPYYVQTLLDVDDQRFASVARGFEHRTSARVFRRLKLRRRLFYTHTSPFSFFSADMHNVPTRRSLLTLAATFLLALMFTVAFTGPSFASGVALLLRGNHTGGVYQIKNKDYPLNFLKVPPAHGQNAPDGERQVSLQVAQQQMHFPIYWPEEKPAAYSSMHINLYVGSNQQWADGPMLEFQYSLPSSTVAFAKGSGSIWIREFKPKADVLQLVKEGASVPIQMDNNGRALAIYVDGEWEMRGKNSPMWVYGQRSELIYQINGVVFWIVGDQRDGIGEQQLMQIAQGLTSHSLDRQFRMMGDTISVEQLSESVSGPFLNDAILVYSDDSSDGPHYINVSPYQPSKSIH